MRVLTDCRTVNTSRRWLAQVSTLTLGEKKIHHLLLQPIMKEQWQINGSGFHTGFFAGQGRNGSKVNFWFLDPFRLLQMLPAPRMKPWSCKKVSDIYMQRVMTVRCGDPVQETILLPKSVQNKHCSGRISILHCSVQSINTKAHSIHYWVNDIIISGDYTTQLGPGHTAVHFTLYSKSLG